MIDLRKHGDTIAREGMIDFAVNIWPAGRTAGLERALRDALDVQGYPNGDRARAAIAAQHGREPSEVLLVNGASEAFWLIAQTLRPRRAACVHPSFTEPEAALRAVDAEVARVFRENVGWRLDPTEVPGDVDIVVIGNPDNPTGALEEAGTVASLAAPDRILLVDESFMDFVLDERGSLAGRSHSGVLVVRSLTKLWSLANIRAGYILGPAELIGKLGANRQPWSVNALACAALEHCAGDRDTPARVAREVASARAALCDALEGLPFIEQVWPGAANFVLLSVDDGPRVCSRLAERGIAVRPAESFPGLDANDIRIAVRAPADCDRLIAAMWELVG